MRRNAPKRDAARHNGYHYSYLYPVGIVYQEASTRAAMGCQLLRAGGKCSRTPLMANQKQNSGEAKEGSTAQAASVAVAPHTARMRRL